MPLILFPVFPYPALAMKKKSYDIIGYVHGRFDKLELLLKCLGYRHDGDNIRSADESKNIKMHIGTEEHPGALVGRHPHRGNDPKHGLITYTLLIQTTSLGSSPISTDRRAGESG
jgi:hypothetical protein